MSKSLVGLLFLSLLSTIGCGGLTALVPTGPSAAASTSLAVSSPQSPVPGPVPQVISGVVKPLAAGGERCYLDLYSCEAYNFSLASDGGVDVTLAWEGGSRDLMIQLYRADIGLIHEDLAPRGGAARISFRRPDLAAMDYQLRVVNLQRDIAIPFTLSYMRWEN